MKDFQAFIKYLTENNNAFIALAAVAAVVMSALTSLIAFIGIIAQNKNNIKLQQLEAVRKLYDNNLQDLGEAAYIVLAQSTILVRKFENQSENPPQEFLDTVNKVKNKIGDAKKILIASRRKNRYVLIGMEDAFQKIARIGDWIKNLENNTNLAYKFIKEGTKLRIFSDKSIIRMHRFGKMPSKIIILKIKYHCWKIEKMWARSRKEYLDTIDEEI
jgi:hypothetical protein